MTIKATAELTNDGIERRIDYQSRGPASSKGSGQKWRI